MHVPRTPLLLLVLLAAAHVLGAAAQEPQELLMEEPMQQSSSTAPQQQAGIVITGPSFTLENSSITLNFIPIYDSGVNGSSGSVGTNRLVITIYEDEANETQTYNVTDTSGSQSFALTYGRGTPGVVLFEASLFVSTVGAAVATNRITVNWLATPEYTSLPPTLNTNEEATILVTPFLYPPGSDVEDEPISGLIVRFEILSGGGRLMTAGSKGSNSAQQFSRAAPLLVPTNSDGEALARLINPGGNASTTVVGISLELGPGVGCLDLGWQTNVTWTVEPASEATIAITGPEFTLEGTNVSLTFKPFAPLLNNSGIPPQVKQAGQLVVNILDDTQPADATKVFDIPDLSAPSSIVVPHQKTTPGTVYFYVTLTKATGPNTFEDIATNSTAVNYMARPNVTVSPATPLATGSAAITVAALSYPPGSDLEGSPVPNIPVRFSVLSGRGSLQAAEDVNSVDQLQHAAASTLLVLSGAEGTAAAKLTNPSRTADTTTIGVSLDFGPGAGRVNLNQTTAVTWTEPPNAFSQITLSPVKARFQVEKLARVTATVTNALGRPVTGIYVSFLIKGNCVGPYAERRTATTDATGRAAVHFRAAYPGTAFVRATAEKDDGAAVVSSPSRLIFAA